MRVTSLRCITCGLAFIATFLSIPVYAQSPAPKSKAPPTRVIIRGGDIIVKVPEYDAAKAKTMELARKYGAELKEAGTSVDFRGKKQGELMLVLDAPKLVPLMNDVRGVGKLYSERVQSTDQTSYYEKLGRRISLLGQNEDELLGFIHSPRRMRGSDILFVQYRLYQSRTEASDATQDQVDLDRAAQHSLLHVMLFEPEPRQAFDWRNWHAQAAYRAKTLFLTVVRKLAGGLYLLLWFAPLWIPAALLLFFGSRRLWRLLRAWRAEHSTNNR